MVWYFYQSQNKLQKRKERLNREKTEGKRKTESSPLTWATPVQLTVSAAQPASSPVVFLPARQSSTLERRRRRGRHLDAQDLPGRPRTPKRAQETSASPSLTFPLSPLRLAPP